MPQNRTTMASDRVELSDAREQEIANLAEAVADEYCPKDRVDPLMVARAERITMSFNNYGPSFDGMLEHRGGRFHIYCNLERVEWQESPRARFTIGHELGHFFIDEHRNALSSGKAPRHGSLCEYESDLLVEREADCFASNLLMPPSRLLQATKREKAGMAGVLVVAALFDTSVTSTAIRYARADKFPLLVMKWGSNGLVWKWFSQSMFHAGYRKVHSTIETIPEACPTRKALSGETPPSAGFFESGTTRAAWFPFIKDHNTRNTILMEQAIALGRYGVLTILYPIPDSK
jgi:hypothetical protein